jgi:hypothetical protein
MPTPMLATKTTPTTIQVESMRWGPFPVQERPSP